MFPKVVVKIIEQPAPDSIRFRYKSDNRSSGPIEGVNSTLEKPTFPTISIQTFNYKGPVVVIASSVTTDEPYRPHPNKLVDGACKEGVHMAKFDSDSLSPIEITYSNVAIERGKQADIISLLNEREKIKIDPFGTGFKHKHNKKNINMQEVRLCFQVFLTHETGLPITATASIAIVSDPIISNSITELDIHDISDPTSSVRGGKKIMIFCNKVSKNDIKIRFFLEDMSFDRCVQSKHVHRQYAISFLTPKYKFQNIVDPVTVYIQLMRKDGSKSEPLPFEYIPEISYGEGKMKKRKIGENEKFYSLLKVCGEKLDPSTTVESVLQNEQQPVDEHLSSLPCLNKQLQQHLLQQGDQNQLNCRMSLNQQQLTPYSSHPSHAKQTQLPSFNNVVQQIDRNRSYRQTHQLSHIEPRSPYSQINHNQPQSSATINLQYPDQSQPNNEVQHSSYNLTQPSCSHFQNANQSHQNFQIYKTSYQSETLRSNHLHFQDRSKQNHQVQQKRHNHTQVSCENLQGANQSFQISQMCQNQLHPLNRSHFQQADQNQQNSKINQTNSDLFLVANNQLLELNDFNSFPVHFPWTDSRETNSSVNVNTHQCEVGTYHISENLNFDQEAEHFN